VYAVPSSVKFTGYVQRCIESTSPIWPDSVGNELTILVESVGLAIVDLSRKFSLLLVTSLFASVPPPRPLRSYDGKKLRKPAENHTRYEDDEYV
jgi:hypothetical protein